MKLLIAFLRLIRSLNLLFILLTQALFQYAIIVPMFGIGSTSPALSNLYFWLLAISSVLIAAAGYIINDYFDLNIDRVNRPDKIVVEKHIKRRWTIIWHWILSLAGILVGFFVGLRTDIIWLGPANAACALVLWFYSTSLKKKLLSGNVVISLLTSWVVLVIGFATHYRMAADPGQFASAFASKLMRFTFLYAGFAFIICLVREVVKDVEDMEGDARYGARTMPLVWGVHVSKVFAGTWLAVLLAALIIVFAYVLQFGWWLLAAYTLLLVIVPVANVLRLLAKAQDVDDFRRLSSWIKMVMFTGILSMLFF